MWCDLWFGVVWFVVWCGVLWEAQAVRREDVWARRQEVRLSGVICDLVWCLVRSSSCPPRGRLNAPSGSPGGSCDLWFGVVWFVVWCGLICGVMWFVVVVCLSVALCRPVCLMHFILPSEERVTELKQVNEVKLQYLNQTHTDKVSDVYSSKFSPQPICSTVRTNSKKSQVSRWKHVRNNYGITSSFDWAFHSQEWSMSHFPCSLTRNITSHSMKNLAFHSLLTWKMIILPILTTFSLKDLENILVEIGSERVNKVVVVLQAKTMLSEQTEEWTNMINRQVEDEIDYLEQQAETVGVAFSWVSNRPYFVENPEPRYNLRRSLQSKRSPSTTTVSDEFSIFDRTRIGASPNFCARPSLSSLRLAKRHYTSVFSYTAF